MFCTSFVYLGLNSYWLDRFLRFQFFSSFDIYIYIYSFSSIHSIICSYINIFMSTFLRFCACKSQFSVHWDNVQSEYISSFYHQATALSLLVLFVWKRLRRHDLYFVLVAYLDCFFYYYFLSWIHVWLLRFHFNVLLPLKSENQTRIFSLQFYAWASETFLLFGVRWKRNSRSWSESCQYISNGSQTNGIFLACLLQTFCCFSSWLIKYDSLFDFWFFFLGI